MRYSLYEHSDQYENEGEWRIYANMILHYDAEQGIFVSPGEFQGGYIITELNKCNPRPTKSGIIIVNDEKGLTTTIAVPETNLFYNTRLLHVIKQACNHSYSVGDLVSKVINTIIRS